MKFWQLLICGWWTALLAFAPAVMAQRLGEPPTTPGDLARQFETCAHPRLSLGEFGRTIEKRALIAAAQQVRDRKLTQRTVPVNLHLEVTLIPMPGQPEPPDLPKPPGPDEIDVCWEICSDMDCYVSCSGPSIDPGRHHVPFRTCAGVWDDYEEATSVYSRLQYLQELLRLGCLQPTAIAIDVVR